MNAALRPDVEEVVFMSASQCAKTSFEENVLGYHIHHDPCPAMMVLPTLGMAEAFSKERFAPTVRESPALRERIADPKSRDSGNTILNKRFPGGALSFVGANSPASLASRPIRLMIFDEIDRYEPTAEGDAIILGNARTATFWNARRLYQGAEEAAALVPVSQRASLRLLAGKAISQDEVAIVYGSPGAQPYSLLIWGRGFRFDVVRRAFDRLYRHLGVNRNAQTYAVG